MYGDVLEIGKRGRYSGASRGGHVQNDTQFVHEIRKMLFKWLNRSRKAQLFVATEFLRGFLGHFCRARFRKLEPKLFPIPSRINKHAICTNRSASSWNSTEGTFVAFLLPEILGSVKKFVSLCNICYWHKEIVRHE